MLVRLIKNSTTPQDGVRLPDTSTPPPPSPLLDNQPRDSSSPSPRSGGREPQQCSKKLTFDEEDGFDPCLKTTAIVTGDDYSASHGRGAGSNPQTELTELPRAVALVSCTDDESEALKPHRDEDVLSLTRMAVSTQTDTSITPPFPTLDVDAMQRAIAQLSKAALELKSDVKRICSAHHLREVSSSPTKEQRRDSSPSVGPPRHDGNDDGHDIILPRHMTTTNSNNPVQCVADNCTSPSCTSRGATSSVPSSKTFWTSTPPSREGSRHPDRQSLARGGFSVACEDHCASNQRDAEVKGVTQRHRSHGFYVDTTQSDGSGSEDRPLSIHSSASDVDKNARQHHLLHSAPSDRARMRRASSVPSSHTYSDPGGVARLVRAPIPVTMLSTYVTSTAPTTMTSSDCGGGPKHIITSDLHAAHSICERCRTSSVGGFPTASGSGSSSLLSPLQLAVHELLATVDAFQAKAASAVQLLDGGSYHRPVGIAPPRAGAPACISQPGGRRPSAANQHLLTPEAALEASGGGSSTAWPDGGTRTRSASCNTATPDVENRNDDNNTLLLLPIPHHTPTLVDAGGQGAFGQASIDVLDDVSSTSSRVSHHRKRNTSANQDLVEEDEATPPVVVEAGNLSTTMTTTTQMSFDIPSTSSRSGAASSYTTTSKVPSRVHSPAGSHTSKVSIQRQVAPASGSSGTTPSSKATSSESTIVLFHSPHPAHRSSTVSSSGSKKSSPSDGYKSTSTSRRSEETAQTVSFSATTPPDASYGQDGGGSIPRDPLPPPEESHPLEDTVKSMSFFNSSREQATTQLPAPKKIPTPSSTVTRDDDVTQLLHTLKCSMAEVRKDRSAEGEGDQARRNSWTQLPIDDPSSPVGSRRTLPSASSSDLPPPSALGKTVAPKPHVENTDSVGATDSTTEAEANCVIMQIPDSLPELVTSQHSFCDSVRRRNSRVSITTDAGVEESPLSTPVNSSRHNTMVRRRTSATPGGPGASLTTDRYLSRSSSLGSIASIQRATPPSETKSLIKTVDCIGNKVINDYSVLCELGRGAQGKVKLVAHKETGKMYALKIIARSAKATLLKAANQTQLEKRSKADRLLSEVTIMKLLRHKNCVRMFEVIDDPTANKMYMVMQYCEQGALFKVNPDGTCTRFREEIVATALKQIVRGLMYLHKHNILHCDIKPDNILVDAQGTVVLTDFGISEFFAQGNQNSSGSGGNRSRSSPSTPMRRKHTADGTPPFFAPEMCSKDSTGRVEDGYATDVWAVGVTVFAMLFGFLPYRGCPPQIFENILTKPIPFPSSHCPNTSSASSTSSSSTSPTVSSSAISLLQRLLEKDPKKRITLKEVRNHPWLQEHDKRVQRERDAAAAVAKLKKAKGNGILVMPLEDLNDNDGGPTEPKLSPAARAEPPDAQKDDDEDAASPLASMKQHALPAPNLERLQLEGTDLHKQQRSPERVKRRKKRVDLRSPSPAQQVVRPTTPPVNSANSNGLTVGSGGGAYLRRNSLTSSSAEESSEQLTPNSQHSLDLPRQQTHHLRLASVHSNTTHSSDNAIEDSLFDDSISPQSISLRPFEGTLPLVGVLGDADNHRMQLVVPGGRSDQVNHKVGASPEMRRAASQTSLAFPKLHKEPTDRPSSSLTHHSGGGGGGGTSAPPIVPNLLHHEQQQQPLNAIMEEPPEDVTPDGHDNNGGNPFFLG